MNTEAFCLDVEAREGVYKHASITHLYSVSRLGNQKILKIHIKRTAKHIARILNFNTGILPFLLLLFFVLFCFVLK